MGPALGFTLCHVEGPHSPRPPFQAPSLLGCRPPVLAYLL